MTQGVSLTRYGLSAKWPDGSIHVASERDIRWTLCSKFVGSATWELVDGEPTCDLCRKAVELLDADLARRTE